MEENMNKSIIKIYWFFIQIYIIYILLLKLNLNIKGISGNAIEWILFPIIIDIFIFILSLIICVYKRKILRANTKVKKAVDTIYLREPPYKYSPVITTYIQNIR